MNLISAEIFQPEKVTESTENDSANDSDATVEGGVVAETENDKVDPCVSGSFFQNKENELRRVKSELTSKKPRKTMSKIVSGHAITEKGIENLMRDHENEQKQTKTSQTMSKKRQSNSKTQKENAPRQKPTVSKMKVKKSQNQKWHLLLNQSLDHHT